KLVGWVERQRNPPAGPARRRDIELVGCAGAPPTLLRRFFRRQAERDRQFVVVGNRDAVFGAGVRRGVGRGFGQEAVGQGRADVDREVEVPGEPPRATLGVPALPCGVL